MVPDWIIVLVGVVSVLSAFVISAIVQVRSQQRGDGLLKIWAKGGSAGCLTMFGIWAAYLLIANLWFRLR